ncbi:MAG TPA: hypothetical protein VLY84_00270 [Dysgonamonadaceae bacterium]|nr:hypothetical protein [Dysgonamonadaceae bacterium]
MDKIELYDAVKRMRALSEANIPFSIGYLTCSITDGRSKGYKVLNKVILRTGMSAAHSDKHNSLIGYYDLDRKEHRWMYLPLLFEFNNIEIK